MCNTKYIAKALVADQQIRLRYKVLSLENKGDQQFLRSTIWLSKPGKPSYGSNYEYSKSIEMPRIKTGAKFCDIKFIRIIIWQHFELAKGEKFEYCAEAWLILQAKCASFLLKPLLDQ